MTPFHSIAAVFIALFFTLPLDAGTIDAPAPNHKGSHEAFLSIFDKSTATTFHEIVHLYDRYISAHPNDVTARIEQLKFLNYVMDGESITNDTASTLFDVRKNELCTKYPDLYDVILFRSKVEEQDAAIELLEKYLKDHPLISSDTAYWELFERLASLYGGLDQPYKSIHYGVIADHLNDTLDITLLLAQQCEKAGDNIMAMAYLGKFPGRSRTYREYMERGELLFKLGKYDGAADMFTHAAAMGQYDYVRLKLSEAFRKIGKYREARDAMTNGEHIGYYDATRLHALYDLDLRYGSADSALHSYNAMRDIGLSTDPLGKYRLELFFRHPFASWQLRDTFGILLFLAVLVVCCGIPVLWNAPVHYAGLLRKVIPPEHSRWNLKHYWIISAVVVTESVALVILFEYTSLLALLGDHARLESRENVSEKAWVLLLQMCVMAGSWMVFLRRSDIAHFWGTKWSKMKSLRAGIGWMLIVRIAFAAIFYLIVFLFKIDISAHHGYDPYTPMSFNLLEDSLVAFRETFGWVALTIAIGIMTPISEEVIFRGVVLRSIQRYIPFSWANILQALLFALIHVTPVLMLNAFLLGITSGILRDKSSSLAPGIALHAGNNLLAVGVLFLQSIAH